MLAVLIKTHSHFLIQVGPLKLLAQAPFINISSKTAVRAKHE